MVSWLSLLLPFVVVGMVSVVVNTYRLLFEWFVCLSFIAVIVVTAVVAEVVVVVAIDDSN